MRALVHLLLIFSVLWCGSHLGEPAQAHEHGAEQALTLDAHLLPGDGDGAGETPGEHAKGGHHHCPIAPDGLAAPALCDPVPATAPLFARRIATLNSLSQAPPVQPPAA